MLVACIAGQLLCPDTTVQAGTGSAAYILQAGPRNLASTYTYFERMGLWYNRGGMQ